jgi:hypothetical protein
MRKQLAILLTVPVLFLGACGGDDEPSTPSPSLKTATVTFSAQSDSGITGTATLTEAGTASTKVVVTLSGAGAGPQPIHIHPGTCANLGMTPTHTLTPVADGKSETTVPAALADLQGGKFAINVHKSAAEVAVYVACGDIA